jgi:Domain of unknown function (DUF1851)
MKDLDVFISKRSAPILDSSIPEALRAVPLCYELLRTANGMELHDGLFRVFGVGDGRLGERDMLVWNRSTWKALYKLSSSLVSWGENIFGDQFCLDTTTNSCALLHCEGGSLEQFPSLSPRALLEAMAGDPTISAEIDLVSGARRRGLCPSNSEHLSFALPLMCGGQPNVENLEILSATAHLEILGQLVEQSIGKSAGTSIRAFKDISR